jgi:hypothetical protein
MIWVHADDQGRIIADAYELKMTVFPGSSNITEDDVSTALDEYAKSGLVILYDSIQGRLIQFTDWWDIGTRKQWSWPSKYPAPDGWQDQLRYKANGKVITKNWGQTPLFDQPAIASQDLTSLQDNWRTLIGEINDDLEEMAPGIDKLSQHEAIKQRLADIGKHHGYDVRSEVPIGEPGSTDHRRIDLCWMNQGNITAAFEIDYDSELDRSLDKLSLVSSPYTFIVLREPAIHIMLVKKRVPEKNTSDRKEEYIDKEVEVEVEYTDTSPEDPSYKTVTKQTRSPETNTTTTTTTTSRNLEEIELIYSQNLGEIIPAIRPELREIATWCPAKMFREAVVDAARGGNGALNLRYVRKICERKAGISIRPVDKYENQKYDNLIKK